MKKISERKEELRCQYYQLEHKLRHVILDEQEHISELSLLFGNPGVSVHFSISKQCLTKAFVTGPKGARVTIPHKACERIETDCYRN